MSTPIVPLDIGAVTTLTGTFVINNNAYSHANDRLILTRTSNLGLLVDFTLNASWTTAPVTGSIQLLAVEWSLDSTPVEGNQATSTMIANTVGTFSPKPSTGNFSTSILMSLPRVPLGRKTSFYLYNNGLGQAVAIGWVLKAQVWTPGTA